MMYSPIHEILIGGLVSLFITCGLIVALSGEDPAPTPNPVHKNIVLNLDIEPS